MQDMDGLRLVCSALGRALETFLVCARSYKCKKNMAFSSRLAKNFDFLTCQGIAKKLYQCKKYISLFWISSAEPHFPSPFHSGDIVKYQRDKESSEPHPGKKENKIKWYGFCRKCSDSA
jgi:hypothetical protein